jgi:hypothetical protein
MVAIIHQYLGQLDGELLDALEGNVATTIAFRSGPRDAAHLARRFAGVVSADTIATQPDLSAILSRTSNASSPRPHTLLVDHNSKVIARRGAALNRFVTDMRAQTHAALVDPHRNARPLDPAEFERPAAPSRSAAAREASFLDEWLDRHGAQRSSSRADDDVAS